jgi:hypothetical protein
MIEWVTVRSRFNHVEMVVRPNWKLGWSASCVTCMLRTRKDVQKHKCTIEYSILTTETRHFGLKCVQKKCKYYCRSLFSKDLRID